MSTLCLTLLARHRVVPVSPAKHVALARAPLGEKFNTSAAALMNILPLISLVIVTWKVLQFSKLGAKLPKDNLPLKLEWF